MITMLKRSTLSFLFVLLFNLPSQASDLTLIIQRIETITPMNIGESYKAIPHGQTTYDASKSSASYEDKKYLTEFFTVTDLMMSARVSTLTNLYYGRGGMSINQYNEAYALSMEGFALLDIPKKALSAHQLIISAIQEHHQFLNNWSNASPTRKEGIAKNYFRDKLVSSSSSKLISAYSRLMLGYKSESRYNKKAFYDHLCALDFK